MKYLFLLLAGGLACLLFPGCHKSSGSTGNSTPTPCTLLSATANNGGLITSYSFNYDQQGRLNCVKVTSSSSKPYTDTLVYGNGFIVSTTTFSGVAARTIDSIFLDAAGNVSSISVWQSGNHSLFTYTRNSQEELTQSTSSYNGAILSTSTYQYSNGDITGGVSAGSPFSYTYFTDKPSKYNDFLAMQQWIQYGVVIWKSAHLCKSYQSSVSQNYTYTLDDKGNITDAVSTDAQTNAVSTVHFVYDCR
ncbi:MAG: hypothetical protein JST42_05990 [Bacteroidetes bacterium]|nr:hypothetical protein [Bacteroidota bacterium]